MNKYPLWKQLLLVVVIIFASIYALPNLYGEDPALQVSATARAEQQMSKHLQEKIEKLLEDNQLKIKSSHLSNQKLLLRFFDTSNQLKAKDVIDEELGRDYISALNLSPATPQWLQGLGADPMYLGLDLRGGVHFLMEVEMEAAIGKAEERYVSDFRTLLRKDKIRYQTIRKSNNGGVKLLFKKESERARAYDKIRDEYDLLQEESEEGSKFVLLASLKPKERDSVRKFALQQNITTLRNRINELGVAEPVIQQQGQNRIVVQLPGVQDTARAKEILGATATLEFRLVDEERDPQTVLAGGRAPVGSQLYKERNGRPVLLKKRVMLTGEYIIDASSGIESQSGSSAVFITLDGKGARRMSNATRDNIGKRMAVVFLESRVESKNIGSKVVKQRETFEEVINVAVIRDQLSKRFQITGLDSSEEARDLALLLRAGALAVPMEIVEERTVGPSLGQANIDKGFQSVVIGFIFVLIFMAIYYRSFGLVADVALTLNLVLMVAILSLLQATLTLPGIAGIVLTVGMAVDANVLIFERIREELKNGNTPQASIHSGYEKAFSTIADANVTTLIAAIVLFAFGTGPIKGFAITLSIGIVTSMFTAIMGTRAIVNLLYGSQARLGKLSI